MYSLKLKLTILKAPNSGTDSQSRPILGLSKLVKQLQVPEPISGLPHCAYLLSVHGTQNQVECSDMSSILFFQNAFVIH
jgi:hypothetical protein